MLARIRKVTNSGDTGASAVEYGLLVAGIAVAIIVVVFLLGDTLNNLFQGVNNELTPAPAPN